MIPGNIASPGPLTSAGGFALDTTSNIIIHPNGNITTSGKVTAGEFIGPIAYANSAGNAAFATLAANANFATLAANAAYSNLAGNALYAEDSNHTVTADFAVLAANANYSLNAGNAVASDTANFAANAGFSTLAGHVTDPSQPNITAVGTLTSLAVSADITAGNVYANGGTVAAATLVGSLAPGAQPNITSLGNLSNLYVAGPATIEGALLVSDDAAITGNLTISGNLNYTSSNNLSIQSPIIEVGGGPNGSPLTTNDGQDRGLYMHVYDSNVSAEVNKFMGWDTSIGEFRFSSNATIANNVITTNEYGNVRANNFFGNFTGNVSGVAANAIHAQVADVANSVAGANVVGDVVGADHANVADVANSVAGANVVGIVANANYAAFSGVAATANLVAGANVTGEVAHAAVANSVAAANIVGTVANANYAAFSGVAAVANTVAGANVTGQVGFAAVANSVAAANIVGTVANANHAAFSNVANTANVAVTVAGANVTGQVAYAAVANSVAGANVGGEVAYAAVANSVAGANVGGEVAYAAIANSVAGANVSGYVADANHANIADAANIAYALSSDLANVEITGGNAGAFLQTDGTGNLTWATPTVGSAIENGSSNVSIPVANGDIELWVGGLWVGNISADNSNVTSNFTAGGNLEGGNLVTGGGVFAFDATVTDIYATGLAQFSNVGNIQILGGSNTQVLSTDGAGNLSWANAGLNYKYTKEWHVDPVNGDDIANDGSYNKPFKTIARAISFTAPTFAQVVYLHAGTYSENVVIANPTENIEIIGVNDTSTCLCTGTWAFTHTGTSLRLSGIRFNGAVTQTNAGDVYFDNCLLNASFAKSGAGYTQFDGCTVNSASFTSNAATVARNGSIGGLTLNNANARVYVYNMISVLTTTVTAGQFYAFDTVLYSSTTTTNAVTSSAGTVVSLFRCNVTNASGTLSRVSFAGNWSVNDTTYDIANSTLTGTNLGTVSYFDALGVRGNISAGNITLSGTGTSVNASQGNILTNQITGTKLNLLNGVYTAAITGGGATSNYTLNLPANVGSNNQVLSSDGTGNLNWQTVSLASTGSNARYVAKNGSDVDGDGSMLKPYLTITAAMNSITDAAPTKRYAIYVNAGEYNEGATLSLKPNVFVVGCETFAVRIVATTFNMNAGSWTGTSDHRSGFSNCLMIGACDWNWSTVTSGAGKLYFYDVQFGSTVNLYGHNNATAQAQFWSCVFFGAMTVSGINIGNHMNCRHFANITLNQHPGGGMATILNASGGDCGTVTLTTTVTDFNRRCALFAKSFYMGGLTVNGASSYADVTNDSLPSAGPTVLNGGNIVYLNSSGATTTLNNLSASTAVNNPIKPAATSATNLGDWGKQWAWTFSYIYGSTGTDLYVISYGSSYGADTTGRNIGVYADGAGLAANVNGGGIVLETSATTGTGNSGNIALTTGTVGTGTRGNVDITTNTVNITGVVSIAGNVLPNASNTYDLGSPTQRWNTLYLSNNTLYLGNIAVGADANSNLTVDGNALAIVNSNGVIDGTATAANVAYSVDGANVTGDVAGSNYANFAGDVVNASQPNITSVGNLTGLVVSGNALVTGNLSVSGNLTYIDVTDLRIQDPVIQLGSGANGAPLTSNDGKDRGTQLHVYDTGLATEVDKFMGWKDSAGEFIFGSNITNANDVITVNSYGNVHAGYFIGNGSALESITGGNVSGTVANANYSTYGGTSLEVANGTSSVSIPVANGNIEMRVGSTMVIDSNAVQTSFLANTVSVQYDLNAGNHVYAASFDASGNITATNIEAYGSLTSGFLTVSLGASFYEYVTIGANVSIGTTLDVTGEANIGGILTVNANSDLAGNVTVGDDLYVNNNMTVINNIQSNTLSVASDANVGALNVSGLSNLGDVANLTLTGGNSGEYLQTDGTGNLSWTAINLSEITNGTSNVRIAASDGNIQVGVGGVDDVVVMASSEVTMSQPVVLTAGVANSSPSSILTTKWPSGNVLSSLGSGFGYQFYFTDGASEDPSTGYTTSIGADWLQIYDPSTFGFLEARHNYVALNDGTGNGVMPTDPTHLTTKQYVDDQIANTANANYANFAGDVVNASQPNITSVGTLDSLTVEGNILPNTTNTHNLGAFNKQFNWVYSGVYATNDADMYISTYGDRTVGRSVNISTDSSGLDSGVDGGNINITTGIIELGSGDTGSINLETGIVDSGTRGNITLSATSVKVYSNLEVIGGTSNLGAVANVKISGGSNAQVLTTNGNGTLSWAAPGLNYKYSKEWHVDPVNGNDTTGDGSYNKPYATVAKALTSTGPSYAQVVYLHAGAYSEAVTIVSPVENVEIIGVNDTGTTQCTGNWAFSHTGTSIRVRNVRFSGTVTQTTTGPVYFDDCTLSSFSKSGTAYTQFDMCDVTTASFTSNALTLFRGGSISSLTVNNASARVYVYNMSTVATTTVTAGIYYAFDSTLYSSNTTTNAITSSAGTTVGVYRSQITNSSGTLSRVSLAGNWTINDATYDLANSTLTGTNLGTNNHFDAVSVRGVSTLGAVANVRITGGSNNQLLRTDGAGNLSFANALTWVSAPVSNTSGGIAGQAAYDAGGNLYVCVAANTWSKISGTTSW